MTEFQIPDDLQIYRATEIFAALADFTRFKILSALTAGDQNVGALVELLRVSQPAVSHHLRLLKDHGLVSACRHGQQIIYSLADEHVRSLILLGLSHAAEKSN